MRDLLQTCDGSSHLDLNEGELSHYRPSYRYLTHTLKVLGRNPRPDLPGVDRPEGVAAVREAEQAWLSPSRRFTAPLTRQPGNV